MIFFDVTKFASARQRSGLMRLSGRLRDELGAAATPVSWPRWDRATRPGDWFLTAELFSEAERPGFRDFLRRRPCPCAAIFADAIPLKHPHITWPQSVARQPDYLKLLSEFDRVWAISQASREELLGFWRWQGIATPPPVEVLTLGADYLSGRPRSGSRQAFVPDFRPAQREAENRRSAAPVRRARTGPSFLCVGILEPRKNQSFLLDVCSDLWTEGLAFDLHLVGRVNPHFGRPIVQRIKTLRRQFSGLHHHASLDDAGLFGRYASARACLLPTLAEGCGLPLLESLWMGVPVVCSDLPVLLENTAGGGCLPVALNDRAAWKDALRRILTDDSWHERLASEASSRQLPTWAESASTLRAALG